MSIKRNKKEAAKTDPIWSFYAKKQSEVTPDIIRNRHNKRRKRELRLQCNRPLRAMKTVAGFEGLRTKRSTSQQKNQPMGPPRFKKDQQSATNF